MAPTSDKKSRAVPNPNPLGLSAREIEIAILAWRCLGDDGKIDKQQLAKLARLGNAESAGRMFRGIKAKIIAALVDLTAVPGTPTNGAGGDDAATAAAADPESPSELASQKKKKKTAGGGKVAGRKRTMKEADDGGSGDEGGKNEGEGGERPKKVAKHVKGKPVVTSKKLKAAEGGADDFEAGEV